MDRENRMGKPKEGWVRQAAQIPKVLADSFRETASTQGAGGVKILTTVGIGIVDQMPEHYREALVRYTVQKTVIDPNRLNSKDLFEFLRQMIIEDYKRSSDGPDAQGSQWYIDRILDPEVTLPPGKKPSDRAKDKRSKGAG